MRFESNWIRIASTDVLLISGVDTPSSVTVFGSLETMGKQAVIVCFKMIILTK